MRTLKTRLRLAALATLPLLAACSDPFWTANIREVRSLPGDSVLLTNADIRTVNRIEGFERRRDVLMERRPDGSEVAKMEVVRVIVDGKEQERLRPFYAVKSVPRQFVCAEPSPDVARVVQAALSAGVAGTADVSTPIPAGLSGPDALKVDAAARVDASRSEAIAQLTRRIATIQLLRDGMYRACEAYANGAIGQEIYTAIVSRYDKIMVTMLLGEMATGNLPGVASIGGQAAAGASADPASALVKAEEEKAKTHSAFLSALDAEKASAEAVVRKRATNEKVAANEKATEEEKRTAKTDLDLAEKAQAVDAEKLKHARRKNDDAIAAAAAAARAAQLGAGRAVTVAAAAADRSRATAPAVEVAEILYRMQRAYLADSNLGSQVLICASEAAQPDDMRGFQRKMCDRLLEVVLSDTVLKAHIDRDTAVRQGELRNERIARVLASLPPSATQAERTRLLELLKSLY